MNEEKSIAEIGQIVNTDTEHHVNTGKLEFLLIEECNLPCIGTAANIIPRPMNAGFPILSYNKYDIVKNCMKKTVKSFKSHKLCSTLFMSFVISVIRLPKFVPEVEHGDSFKAFLYNSDFRDAWIFIATTVWKT